MLLPSIDPSKQFLCQHLSPPRHFRKCFDIHCQPNSWSPFRDTPHVWTNHSCRLPTTLPSSLLMHAPLFVTSQPHHVLIKPCWAPKNLCVFTLKKYQTWPFFRILNIQHFHDFPSYKPPFPAINLHFHRVTKAFRNPPHIGHWSKGATPDRGADPRCEDWWPQGPCMA